MVHKRRALRKVRVDIRSVGIPFHGIHSLRHANRCFKIIFKRAKAGVPQAIRTPDRRFVVVISVDAYRRMTQWASQTRSVLTR
jgi:hypothetical protein